MGYTTVLRKRHAAGGGIMNVRLAAWRELKNKLTISCGSSTYTVIEIISFIKNIRYDNYTQGTTARVAPRTTSKQMGAYFLNNYIYGFGYRCTVLFV